MEDKIKIIDEIVKRHPAYGLEKGWSYYIGGMRDSGDWCFRKMIDVPLNELQDFLNHIIEDENKPEIKLTQQEIADSKIIYKTGINGWETRLFRKQREEFDQNIEAKWLFNNKTK